VEAAVRQTKVKIQYLPTEAQNPISPSCGGRRGFAIQFFTSSRFLIAFLYCRWYISNDHIKTKKRGS